MRLCNERSVISRVEAEAARMGVGMSNTDLLEQILTRLSVVKGPDGRGDCTCWCPFHNDGNGKPPHSPNLNVSERGERNAAVCETEGTE